MDEHGHRHWWDGAVLYEIYVRSFQDSNGDGVGDLPGIIERLEYLKGSETSLGIDAIWLTPFYPSPMADFGYDVSNYEDVEPLFGTIADIERLIAEAHARDIKVVIDFVPNHVSVEHGWFRESRSSRTSAKRDWFIWADPAPDGGPPNNWLSVFGGGGWELDPGTGQYYYHHFLTQQPDLNWRNPEVREAIAGSMRFWLRRGVDGIRFDAVQVLTEDPELRDNPPATARYRKNQMQEEFFALDHVHTMDHPDNLACIEFMRTVMNEFPNALMLGEVYLLDAARMARYYVDGRGFHLCFNFNLSNAPWDARLVRDAVELVEAALPSGAQASMVLGSHDEHRLVTRLGETRAAAAALLLLALRGVPMLYYGDELGMADGVIADDQMQDPWAKAGPGLGRDPERTPMPWDPADGPSFGFSTARPWLPLASSDPAMSVAGQLDDPDSMLSLYRRTLAWRTQSDALKHGEQRFRDGMPEDVLGIERWTRNQNVLALVHMGDADAIVPLDDFTGRIAVATDRRREGATVSGSVALAAGEAVILERR
jgi:alpha-glucosidase